MSGAIALSAQAELTPTSVRVGLGCFLAAALALAFAAPPLFWVLLAAAAGCATLALAWRAPVPACVAWLLIAGSTPEFWLGDLVGQAALIVAAVKLAGLLLVAICAARWGFRPDWTNPGLAFLVMGAIGAIHGLHPNLTPGDSLRTLVGSAAPFAFAFARTPRRWGVATIRATCWLAPLGVLAAVPLAVSGIRPLFASLDGWRLVGLSHPAYLAGIALAGVYACLIELFRGARRREMLLLGANFAILLLTGARAPLALAVAVAVIALLFLPSRGLPLRARLALLLAAGLAAPVALVAADQLSAIRLFNLITTDAGGLSGRDLMWPYFEEAWNASPWVGWGVGAGKVLIDPDSLIAHLLGTETAHNEYLRIGVDGGWVGLSLLVGLLALWCWRHTRGLVRTDRVILRLAFVAFAVHSATDSTLIASTASVFFTFVCAVFARGAAEASLARYAGPLSP